MIQQNTRILLVNRPSDNPTKDNFVTETQTDPIIALQDGQVLVRTFYISLDPYLLMVMGKAGVHADKLPDVTDRFQVMSVGDVFGGGAVGRVVASKHEKVHVGDVVVSDLWKWQQYSILNVDTDPTFEKLDKKVFGDSAVKLSHALGLLSYSGSHALYGVKYLSNQNKGNSGKTLVVSAAGGSIGNVVGQLGKIFGFRVVGIAGGKDKCEKLKQELGFDDVVDYKQANNDTTILSQLLLQACPDGIDAYFDNVGGMITQMVNQQLNANARVYLCGAISSYANEGLGVNLVPEESVQLYHKKNVTFRTSLGAEYLQQTPQARKELLQYMKDGKLTAVEWIVDGLENTPQAFEDMYKGKNFGKAIVKVFDETQ